MAQPGSIGNIMPSGADWIGRRLDQLQRQLDDLRRARSLEASTIGAGGLKIKGDGGLTVSDGGDVTIEDGGTLKIENSDGDVLPLSQLAFGIQAASVSGAEQADAGDGWHDLSGPSVTVDVLTGRLFVLVSCNTFNSLGKCETVMSWSLSGPTDVTEDELRGFGWNGWGASALSFGAGYYGFLHTGLTNGSYTVTARYNALAQIEGSDTGFWTNRSVVVLPF